MKRINRHRRESGTQTLELALVLPFLLFMGLAIAEGAGMVVTHQVLNNAAREGARLSSSPENSCAGNTTCLDAIRQAVVDYAAQNNITISTANVGVAQQKLITTPSGVGISGSQVTVSYPYSFRYLPRLPISTVPGQVTLVGTAEFRNLY